MIFELLGKELAERIVSVIPEDKITEIRLRLGKKIAVKDITKTVFITEIATQRIIEALIDNVTARSRYAFFEEIKSGYIYCKDGIRVGLAGDGVVQNGALTGIKSIRHVNLRLAHDIEGVASRLYSDSFSNTLIISPPFCGKTTVIRDYARHLAKAYDVSVVDERYELFGKADGGYSFKTGERMDIVSGVPKSLCVEGIIRAMSPEIVVLDEVFPAHDLYTLRELSRSGIKILASLHAENPDRARTALPEITSLFTFAVTLSNKPTVGHIQSVTRLQ